MERLTKSQLESKTVPELKALCDALSLQVEGMKKGEIIECLLNYYEELEKASVDGDKYFENLEDTSIETIDSSENIQCEECKVSNVCETDSQIVSEAAISEEENVVDDKDSSLQFPRTINVRKPKMLYKDESLTIPICHVGGKLNLLSQSSSCYKAVVIISGRGQLEGYLAR